MSNDNIQMVESTHDLRFCIESDNLRDSLHNPDLGLRHYGMRFFADLDYDGPRVTTGSFVEYAERIVSQVAGQPLWREAFSPGRRHSSVLFRLPDLQVVEWSINDTDGEYVDAIYLRCVEPWLHSVSEQLRKPSCNPASRSPRQRLPMTLPLFTTHSRTMMTFGWLPGVSRKNPLSPLLSTTRRTW